VGLSHFAGFAGTRGFYKVKEEAAVGFDGIDRCARIERSPAREGWAREEEEVTYVVL
jgi:hypothetical protein